MRPRQEKEKRPIGIQRIRWPFSVAEAVRSLRSEPASFLSSLISDGLVSQASLISLSIALAALGSGCFLRAAMGSGSHSEPVSLSGSEIMQC